MISLEGVLDYHMFISAFAFSPLKPTGAWQHGRDEILREGPHVWDVRHNKYQIVMEYSDGTLI